MSVLESVATVFGCGATGVGVYYGARYVWWGRRLAASPVECEHSAAIEDALADYRQRPNLTRQ